MRKNKITSYILITLPLFILLLVLWSNRCFNKPKIDEVIYTLSTKVGGTDPKIILGAIYTVLIPVIIFSIIYFIVSKYIKNEKIYKYLKIFGIIFIVFDLCFIDNNYELIKNIKLSLTKSNFIKDNYVKTSLDSVSFDNDKSNLIVIYSESMESSYMDKSNSGLYDKNYIPKLTELAKENTSFINKDGGAYPLDTASWTTAGIVSVTSGTTIKPSIKDIFNRDSAYSYKNIVTLSDILKYNDYSTEFMLGSDVSFGAKEEYLKAHNIDAIYDLNYAKENNKIKEEDLYGWGIKDVDLFNLAKEELDMLSKKDNPFFLSILTVDTHAPSGTSYDECALQNEKDYFNAIRCSDEHIYEFIEYLKEKDYYDNTVIVILGDHLSMSSRIKKDNNRRIYNTIINSKRERNNISDRKYANIDMFPTILYALGANIKEDKLGLGVNLYSDNKTLIEEYGYEKVNNELSSYSKFYNENIANVN